MGATGRSDVKDALRKLYKLVHPDLFNAHQAAKVENERSFKLLQEYLELARSSDQRSPAARTAFCFRFFLRPPGEGPPGKGDKASSDSSFKLVEVTLPPPQPFSGNDPKHLSSSVRGALAKLFNACGLGDAFPHIDRNPWDWSGADASSLLGSPSLAAFLPWAAEQLRLNEASNSDPALRLANLQGALRLSRQLLVGFSSDCNLPMNRRAVLVSRLISLLDLRPGLDLHGCRVMIGEAVSGIDRLGNLCLHQEEMPEEWLGLLEQVDVAFVLDRSRYVLAVKGLENAVAAMMGLSMIYTTPLHLPEPSYRSFLERAAHHSSSLPEGSGKVASGRLSLLSICCLPEHCRHTAQGSPLGRTLPDGCVVDEALGIIHVLDSLTGHELYDWVERIGDKAALAARVHANTQAAAEARVAHTRRALRLKRLMKDPRVAARDFDAACARLLEQAASLAPGLDGCSLRIGFATRMAPDGSCIELAWDFRD